MGDFEAGVSALVESTLKYHPSSAGRLTTIRYPDLGPRLVGSLTGAVASQKVTEAPQGLLSVVGHHTSSARAQGGLTARPTGRAGTKVGPSDPMVACGSAIAKRLKGTPGITGLSCPSVHSDGRDWHLDVGSSHPGGGAAPKGPAVRRLKRYASWV